jgi:two-component system C4-dicarboxylate transport response regulator DctD
LQERVIERLGSNDEVAVDLQVVAATKADLHQLARQGRFREDLAYRLDIARVELPALSVRRGDVALLFRHFLDLAARRQGRAAPHVDATVLAELDRRNWPGNVRELRNVAERYVLGLEDLPTGVEVAVETLEARMDRVERAILVDSLAEQEGRIGVTADMLGISRKTLYLKMRKHGLGGEEEA